MKMRSTLHHLCIVLFAKNDIPIVLHLLNFNLLAISFHALEMKPRLRSRSVCSIVPYHILKTKEQKLSYWNRNITRSWKNRFQHKLIEQTFPKILSANHITNTKQTYHITNTKQT